MDCYSDAIDLDDANAVYFANRAFCHLKLENYGSAQQDASKAIELDPDYAKGYYRRASAFFAIGKYEQALNDFKAVQVYSKLES